MRRLLLLVVLVLIGTGWLVSDANRATPRMQAAEAAPEAAPDNSGPVELLTASWLGGPFDDELLAAAIAADGTIWLAGNSAHLGSLSERMKVVGPEGKFDALAAPPPPDRSKKKQPEWRHPSTHGFVVHLSGDGRRILGGTRFGYGLATVRRLRLDGQGRLWLLAQATQPLNLISKEPVQGTFLAVLSADGQRLLQCLCHPEMIDFALDSNGEVVVLAQGKLTRYAPDGRTQRWVAGWKVYGSNRPHALAVVPQSGIAVVTGYGMTHTSKEPYKDPYAIAFDREGKQLWMLWHPDPRLQRASKWATPALPANGLMADTAGRFLYAGPDGRIYIILFADGGNSICTRDPRDPFRPLDPQVFAGVFQATPGFGFRGASRTSVIFRLDPTHGRLEKGTWMCAWRDKSHANYLSMEAAALEATGLLFVVGNSAAQCPTLHPWYVCRQEGYPGGGFLAVFDHNFHLLQCGYFPGANLSCVAVHKDVVVAAGRAKQYEDEKTQTFTRIFQAPQQAFGGGSRDGYFVVLRLRPNSSAPK